MAVATSHGSLPRAGTISIPSTVEVFRTDDELNIALRWVVNPWQNVLQVLKPRFPRDRAALGIKELAPFARLLQMHTASVFTFEE